MGAKTSIAESVDTLFCFTKISNHLVLLFLFQRNVVILSFNEESEILLCFMSTGRVYAKAEAFTKHLIFRSKDVVMILPQVHLRKPCYDFTFL